MTPSSMEVIRSLAAPEAVRVFASLSGGISRWVAASRSSARAASALLDGEVVFPGGDVGILLHPLESTDLQSHVPAPALPGRSRPKLVQRMSRAGFPLAHSSAPGKRIEGHEVKRVEKMMADPGHVLAVLNRYSDLSQETRRPVPGSSRFVQVLHGLGERPSRADTAGEPPLLRRPATASTNRTPLDRSTGPRTGRESSESGLGLERNILSKLATWMDGTQGNASDGDPFRTFRVVHAARAVVQVSAGQDSETDSSGHMAGAPPGGKGIRARTDHGVRPGRLEELSRPGERGETLYRKERPAVFGEGRLAELVKSLRFRVEPGYVAGGRDSAEIGDIVPSLEKVVERLDGIENRFSAAVDAIRKEKGAGAIEWIEDEDLAARLQRILKRQARRRGIDFT